MSEESFDYGTVKIKCGSRGFLELQNCPKIESDPNKCIICDKFKGFINETDDTVNLNELFKSGIKCSMVSNIKCGNSLCFNYDIESTTNCNRFGKVIECRVFQKLNQDSGGNKC